MLNAKLNQFILSIDGNAEDVGTGEIVLFFFSFPEILRSFIEKETYSTDDASLAFK